MKTMKFFLLAVIPFSLNFFCSAQTIDKNEPGEQIATHKIEVYYFHYSRRCATCNAVENVTKEALAELYGSKARFAAYNLDEADGEIKGKELEISGQTLSLIAGETRINLTNEGFMHARTNPDKLKQIIKEKIDPFL